MKSFDRILITGTTSGLGYGFLDHYARLNKKIICVNRRHDDSLTRDFPLAKFEKLDITHFESVEKLLLRLKHQDELPDLFILNAGINKMDNAHGLDFAAFQEVMRTNLDGVMTFVAALSRLRVRGKTIAVVSSTANIVPNPRHIAYHLSKWAVERAFTILGRTDKTNCYKSVVLGPVHSRIMRHCPQPQGLQKRVFDALVIEPHGAIRACARFFERGGRVLYYPLWVCLVYAAVRVLLTFNPRIYAGTPVSEESSGIRCEPSVAADRS